MTSPYGAGYWLGGFQPAGSTEPAGGWRWITNEPFSFQFWQPNEPNNNGGNEDTLIYWGNPGTNSGDGKKWNDVGRGFAAPGYVVEYAPAPNQAPKANAGPDQTVKEGSTVTLDGSGSTDPDGDTLTYSWAQTGGTAVTLSDNTAAKPTFTAPSVSTAGDTLTFDLTVNDGKGGTAKDTVSIIVQNDVPLAALKANPTTIDEGKSSALDASTSTSGTSIATYEFTQTPGSTPGTITVDSTNPAKATFTAPEVAPAGETATIQVKVTDNDGDSSTATVDVTINSVNKAPVANDQSVSTDEDTPLPITLTATDVDGDALTYSIVGNPSHGILSGTPPDVTYNPAADYNGDDSFTFKANDGTVDSNIAKVSITVKPVNDKPIVSTLKADPSTINEEGGTSALAASATDPDGDTLTYSWLQTAGTGAGTSNNIAIDPNDPSKATFTAPSITADEIATIQVTVDDRSAGGTASNTVDITVKNVNKIPMAHAGQDFAVNEGTTGVQLKGSGSDPDGTIASYHWEQTSGPNVLLSNADTDTATFDAPQVTANTPLTFKLTVTDNDGAPATDEITVTVNNVNQPPTANAGADQTVNEGDTVTMDGSGSSDPDGTIASYSWTQTAGKAVTLSDANTKAPSFSAPNVDSAGDTLTFELTVTDNDGTTSSTADSVNIKVNNVNQEPVAKITADKTSIEEGQTASLDASGSSDPDGTITKYEFTQTKGTLGTITIDSNNPAKATFKAPSVTADEIATIQVKVTDNDLGTATATVDIAVKNVPSKDATLALSISPSKVKVGKSYTASGALFDVATQKGLPGSTITIKTFDSSGKEITALTKATTTATQYGTYTVSMRAPSTAGTYTIQSFFDGDSDYKPAQSNKKTLTVQK